MSSTPDPSPSVSVAISRHVAAASQTPMTQSNTVKTPSSQPPPASPYRAIAPLHRHPRRPHQDPCFLHRFGSSGQGFSQNFYPVVYPAERQGWYPSRPLYTYKYRYPRHEQLGSNLDPMIQPSPQLGSGLMKAVSHFLQPQVALPHTSILDNSGHKNARSGNEALFIVRKRKVRITEGASLYSLCRSWLRNGAHEEIQPQPSDTITYIPKPLPVDMMETNSVEELNCKEEEEDEESVKHLSNSDLLKRHVGRAKKVRARFREARSKKIARYKARLTFLLPPSEEK